MANPMGLILMQALYYGITMLLTAGIIMVFLRGFLWTYFAVRTSFGKYLMVKVRNPLRDYFKKGWVDEGFLVYKHNKDEKRLALIPGENYLYRCLNVYWIDVDEETNSIVNRNYANVTGFDAIKFSDLLKRALMRPTLGDNKEKIMIVLLIGCILGIGVLIYLAYVGNTQTGELIKALPQMFANIKGTVVGSVTNI